MEILQVIRTSANVPTILGTFTVPSEITDPVGRKKIVTKAEELFREKLGLSVDDKSEMEEFEMYLDDGYGEENDGSGDVISLIWSFPE